MKFLSISTVKDMLFTLPPVTNRQIVEVLVAWMNQQRQAGKVLEAYIIPGWRRTVVISEHESAENLVRIQPTLPRKFRGQATFGSLPFCLHWECESLLYNWHSLLYRCLA